MGRPAHSITGTDASEDIGRLPDWEQEPHAMGCRWLLSSSQLRHQVPSNKHSAGNLQWGLVRRTLCADTFRHHSVERTFADNVTRVVSSRSSVIGPRLSDDVFTTLGVRIHPIFPRCLQEVCGGGIRDKSNIYVGRLRLVSRRLSSKYLQLEGKAVFLRGTLN